MNSPDAQPLIGITDTATKLSGLTLEALTAHDSCVGSVTAGEALERGVPLCMLQSSIPQELIERGRALGLEYPPCQSDHRAVAPAAPPPASPSCNIRRASAADAAAISTMCVRVASAEIDTSGPTPAGRARLFEDTLGEEAILGVLEGGDVFIALMDGTVVGTAMCKRPFGAQAGALQSHLHHMYVERSGIGIGKRLWAELHRLFVEEGVEQVTVNSSMNAVLFYERLGFRKEGGESDAGGMRSQPMIYALDFDQSNERPRDAANM